MLRSPTPDTATMTSVLTQELEDGVAIHVSIDADDMLNIVQGDDWICMPLELYEAFATQIMGAVMAARRQLEDR